jgi:tetratricopeptide (TPR) repeat protein
VKTTSLFYTSKSQIAIEYSYRLKAKLPSTWVFWVHASSYTRFEQGYRDIANRLKLPSRNNPKVDILQIVSQWLQDETNGSWLLILDNADDANMFTHIIDTMGQQPTQCKEGETSYQSLLKYIPQTSKCLVLVTSRNSDAAARITGNNNMINIGLMSETESLALLKAKLGHELLDVDSLELIQALGQIPLAITQAAAYISRPARRMSIAKYLELFRESEMNQRSLLDKDEGDLRRDPDVPNAVISTWEISFNQIRRENPFAADLLSLMSALNRQGIAESFLRGDSDRLAFADALTVLCGFSLIIEESRGGCFGMHRLVQLATRKWLDAHGEMVKWNQKALMMVSKAFPAGRFENWTECIMLLPHAEAVLSCSLSDKDDLLNQALILHNLSWYFWLKGDYWLSKLKIDQAIEIRRNHLTTKDNALLASIDLCGTVLSDQGRYEEAERMYRQTLELREKVLGLEHPETLTSMGNLGLVLSDQGRYEEAERMQRQTLELREKVLGLEHPETLASMSNLGLVLSNQGRYVEAERMHRQTLELSEKVLGLEHPSTLASMSNLGLVLSRLGRYEEAERMQRQTLELKEKVLGLEHPETLTSMSNLALTLSNQGRYEEAERMQRQTLELKEKVLGLEHPSTLISVWCLASLLHSRRQYQNSNILFQRACTGYLKILGPEHPSSISCLKQHATLLEDMKRQNQE